MRRFEDGWLIKMRVAPGARLLRVVAPRIPLDGENSQVLCALLAPFLSAGCPCRLTVVLGNVASVSGLALRVFARLHEWLSAGGGRLTLSGPPAGLCEEAGALGLTQAPNIRGPGPRRGARASRSCTPAAHGGACPPPETCP
jgi:hypothetical protein